MVFFFSNAWLEDYSRGITKKVNAQIKALDNAGKPVSYYMGYKDDGCVVCNKNDKVVKSKKWPTNKFVSRVLRNYYLKDLAYDFLKENEESELKIAYIRDVFFDRKTLRILKQAKKNNLFVIYEIHSYPRYTWSRKAFWIIYLIDIIYKKRAIKYIDRLAAMTDEKLLFPKEIVRFENGIDLCNILPQNKKGEKEGCIRIISVSYECEVHGYDRMLLGLAEYKKKQVEQRYQIKLILVGTILPSTRQLIQNLGLEDDVVLPGVLSGKELEEMYNQCDMGMGCLAIHRRGTLSVSSLKVKEYIAKGIPFFFAGRSLFQSEDFPYALTLESKEGPINVEGIIDFYQNTKDMPDRINKMREWAKKYSWDVQMEKVVDGIK